MPIVQEAWWAPKEVADVAHILWLQFMVHVISHDNCVIIIIIDMNVSCHRSFFPGTSLEPAVIPTAQASSFTLQYFPYYV